MKARRPEDSVARKFSEPVQLLPQPPSICWTTLCEHCGRTFISCVKRFPTPYSCAACIERLGLHKAWLATHPVCRNGHVLTEGTVSWNHVRPGQHTCRICQRARAVRQRRARVEAKRLDAKAP